MRISVFETACVLVGEKRREGRERKFQFDLFVLFVSVQSFALCGLLCVLMQV